MRISLLVAVAQNGVIGRDGKLPWHLPDELKWFRAVTMGHHVVMGRRTFESLPKPLVGRRVIVLTRSGARYDTMDPPVDVVETLEAAIALARDRGETELVVAGGAQVYAQALPLADRVYLTEVQAEVPGDAVLPPLEPARASGQPSPWIEVERRAHAADDRHAFAFVVRTLDRRASSAGPDRPTE